MNSDWKMKSPKAKPARYSTMRSIHIVEYLAGFAFGLFIFQSLFMQSMMGGTYWENVRRTFLPELISMNFMMAGMAPVMCFLMMSRDMRAMEPSQLLFWGIMSLGVTA